MEWDYGGGDGYNGGNDKEVWDCGGGKAYNPRTKACECPDGMVDNGYECVLDIQQAPPYPHCSSFEYAKPPGASVRACAVVNLHETFYSYGVQNGQVGVFSAPVNYAKISLSNG